MSSEPATPSTGSTRPARAGSGHGMSPRSQRLGARIVHLAAALAVGTYVYAPPSIAQPLRLFLEVIIVPVATLTGLFMWRQAQIRRWLTTRFRSSPRTPRG